MEWFLYDREIRHERVKDRLEDKWRIIKALIRVIGDPNISV